MIVLAGDIGGTNSRFALFEGGKKLHEQTLPSAGFTSLEDAIDAFLQGATQRPERACLAVAGPVENGICRVTNLTWTVDARRLADKTRLSHVQLVNDFQAAAFGVTLLGPEHLHQLGGGARNPHGPIVVLGAGTGLGEAFLTWSEADSRYQVLPSEGGHADFTPRTAIETGLAAFLAARYKRASYERVLSGPGIRDIFSFLMSEPACRSMVAEETRLAIASEDPPAVIVRQALAGRDPICALALQIFASSYGACAGNLALTVLATGGVFIAGGIAPRILPVLDRGAFREAFEAKGRMQPFLAKLPVFVVTQPDVGLLGAAALAARG